VLPSYLTQTSDFHYLNTAVSALYYSANEYFVKASGFVCREYGFKLHYSHITLHLHYIHITHYITVAFHYIAVALHYSFARALMAYIVFLKVGDGGA